MQEHLQRALVEVYYAIAEFNQNHETMPTETRADACAQLFVVRANLEKLLSERAVEMKRAA